MTLRPCLDCRRPTSNGSRCPSCQQAWDARRPSRHKRGYGTTYDRLRRQVLAEETHCWLCGGFVPEGDKSVDHVVPLSKGGSEDRLNLRLAHKRCNTSKHDRIVA